MHIQDVMSKDVVSIRPDADVETARETLHINGIDHLVVMDGKRIAGIVSERDLSQAAIDQPLRYIMHHDVVTVAPDATLRQAAGIMRGRAIGSLPVVDEGRLVGIVTTSDLLTALSKGEVHAAPKTERRILRKRGPRKRPIPV
jgi:acetoin utilization protein AcuB